MFLTYKDIYAEKEQFILSDLNNC